jgi:hypothetical protein
MSYYIFMTELREWTLCFSNFQDILMMLNRKATPPGLMCLAKAILFGRGEAGIDFAGNFHRQGLFERNTVEAGRHQSQRKVPGTSVSMARRSSFTMSAVPKIPTIC